jgi:hypothetical protein
MTDHFWESEDGVNRLLEPFRGHLRAQLIRERMCQTKQGRFTRGGPLPR